MSIESSLTPEVKSQTKFLHPLRTAIDRGINWVKEHPFKASAVAATVGGLFTSLTGIEYLYYQFSPKAMIDLNATLLFFASVNYLIYKGFDYRSSSRTSYK